MKNYYCPMCPGIENEQPGNCSHCGMALEKVPTLQTGTSSIYTCPMHPEIEKKEPGNCPLCGMTLEQKTFSSGQESENYELRDMSQRFWTALLLTFPILLITMGGMSSLLDRWFFPNASQWLQLILTIPVVFWAGMPLFERAWQAFVNRRITCFL